MRLGNLLKDVNILASNVDLNLEINDIKICDKAIKRGDIFVALNGITQNGNNFIDSAFEKGASIVISDEKEGSNIINVDNARKAYALICKNFFNRCCEKLKIIAITGTNGKTTIANITGEILNYCDIKTGVIGTLGAKIEDEIIDTHLTTPDPYLLHSIFKTMKEKGCEYVVMEASAHALFLNKLEGINFEIGVLTNITQDHLDYFKTMKNYADAKFELFNKKMCKTALICTDDKYGKDFFVNCKVPVFNYGIKGNSFYYAKNIRESLNGSEFDCKFSNNIYHVSTNLAGHYNINNTLAVLGICDILNLPFDKVKEGLTYINPVEGRFNIINLNDYNVVIDYAHTPDGLENVLKTAKQLSGDKKVVVIFGCGGNRDRQKRPLMGKIASQIADVVILTSDNPRYEQPMSIIEDIKKGIEGKCFVIENRKDAIKFALSNFHNGETIVIAGKGAEKYQEINGTKFAYNDFDEVYQFCRYNLNNNKF